MLRGPIRALRIVNDWRAWAIGLAVAVGWAFVEARDAWSPPGGQHRALVKLSIHWGLWLAWPAALWLLVACYGALRRGRAGRALAALVGLACVGAVLWARFVEPQQLRVVETTVGSACGARVALISDLHVGLYVREDDVQRLVRRLNALDVDAVLVAGDWTYEPPHELRAAFLPFALLRHPVYAVLGNHDEGLPGADLKAPLMQALRGLRVQWIEGRRVPLGRCELAGLGDLEAGAADRDLAALAASRWSRPPAQRVLLTHESDTLYRVAPHSAALLLAGHTHGGQIDLPWLTDELLRRISRSGYKRGLYAAAALRVFVTSGTGMTKLPMRFRMPPTIDVLVL